MRIDEAMWSAPQLIGDLEVVEGSVLRAECMVGGSGGTVIDDGPARRFYARKSQRHLPCLWRSASDGGPESDEELLLDVDFHGGLQTRRTRDVVKPRQHVGVAELVAAVERFG